MQLVERNGFEVQATQAHLDTLVEVLRATHRCSFCWSLAGDATFRCDH